MLQQKADTICDAIEQRRELSFVYRGHPRRVQPAGLGSGPRVGRSNCVPIRLAE